VLVKKDVGSGGAGVFGCGCEAEIRALAGIFTAGPVLVQKRIEGQEVDLSGVYFARRLVHFAHAEIERTTAAPALSKVRRYRPGATEHGALCAELHELGEALGASGFVSISAMEAADGSGRYFFEADMRPTVWVDVTRLYGDDVAGRIRGWFECRESMMGQGYGPAGRGEGLALPPVRLAHFQRLKIWELMINRYGVWATIPWVEWRMVLALVWAKLCMPASRKIVPRRLRQVVRRGMVAAGVAFP
jgi:hypothetical protein